MTRPLAAVVMAAGLGTRMKSRVPKHLHPLVGRRMVDWVVDAVRALGSSPFVVVCSPEAQGELAASLPEEAVLAVQADARGTGDAVAAARTALGGHDGPVLIVPGDAPLLTADLLEALVKAHTDGEAAVTISSIETDRPLAYGRVVRDASGDLSRIVEERDATAEELAIRELNASLYVFSAPDLWWALERLDADNAQGELYLTDTVGDLVANRRRVAVHRIRDSAATEGVNTREELARAAALLRERILRAHMLAGVTIVDPTTTWIEYDVTLEPDAVVHPFTFLRGRTVVRGDASVGPHVVAHDAEIGTGVTVGPFCYLRPGTVLEAGSKAGAFVEVKNSRIGERTKVPHLSYIGDADIGEDTNIGAGAITANYRPELGSEKQRTVIGRNVHTGSDNVFLAPVQIGDNAWVGAGSTITEDVPDGALAVARAQQVNKEDYRGRDRNH